MSHPSIDDFCAQVCEHVRFSPDHRAITEELTAHLEDHMDALVARGIPPEAAAEQAVAAMGDPEEIGKELDKSHSPLLGRFQELFRALVWTALAVLLVFAIPWAAETVQNLIAPPVYSEYDTLPLLEQYDKLKLVADYEPGDTVCRWRGYTFSVERVLVTWQFDSPDTGYLLQANCLLKAVHPNPWLRLPMIDGWLCAEDDLGNLHLSWRWYEAMDLLEDLYPAAAPAAEEGTPLYSILGGATYATPFVTYYDLRISHIDPKASQLTLRFDRYGETPFSFTLPLQGGETYA